MHTLAAFVDVELPKNKFIPKKDLLFPRAAREELSTARVTKRTTFTDAASSPGATCCRRARRWPSRRAGRASAA